MFGSSRTSVTAMVSRSCSGSPDCLTCWPGRPVAAQSRRPAAVVEFTPDGKLKKPVGYRQWVYVGTPLTPNELNGGEAPFPEFHAVYIDPESFAHYEKTGEFRDGTVMIKELSQRRRQGGDQRQGLLHGRLHGLEASIKDSKRFKDEPGNWAYFSFGHKYPLKAEAAKNAATSVQHSATRTTPRRTGSSASTTPSCVRRPRVRSEASIRAARRSGPSRTPSSPKPRRHTP